ncbi:DUF411 domain-containing protein [Stutzerimonas stutzeri]|uniref:DUF411 domain-containing protein n=1 Tax=Stutzerimonas stutzeri TaxID=316 RepID=UPI000D203812|nr:DUF411 domain-containing protein [Stutzerimonas stutzeri]AVX15281.1 DUF411 domain-containing protein [Stutzerimonas stutzeri]RRV52991.1 DUF411 domain-containing protein [Stutzerimonas stutzeri]RRV57090.1 DUF411 domain-containing protein [Stutzerimonas stutzeri]RRV87672.1 DUF411 domain-containing protein [Stutzerimonas stutzeri]RRV95961.1 DUF411 domain-containing protein [Stutzerimonas stutzeri]
MKPYLTVLAALLMSGAAQSAEVIDVHRDANCGCCKDWIKYLETNGFEVRDHVEVNMLPVKERLGVPPRLGSCHTGVIGGKFVEGHVPVAAIRELQQRDDLAGVAVPGMPAGSPGMDYGQPHQRYQVIGLTSQGRDLALGDYLGSQPLR